MFLKMTPKKSQLRLGKCYKLSLEYCGLFQILKKIGKWMENSQCLPSEFLKKICVKLLQDLSQFTLE